MAKIKVCDICRKQIDSNDHNGYRIKQNKLFMSSTEHRWLRGWEEIDLCDCCMELLTTMCYDRKFIKYAIDEWKRKTAK